MTYFTDPNNSLPPVWPNPWYNAHLKNNDLFQTEIEFFWPLTEQIKLDLDYTGCDTRTTLTSSYTLQDGTAYTLSTVATNIAPQLTITPNNPVGELSIGGINVGIEKKPSWLQRKLYKLLGFNWKDK